VLESVVPGVSKPGPATVTIKPSFAEDVEFAWTTLIVAAADVDAVALDAVTTASADGSVAAVQKPETKRAVELASAEVDGAVTVTVHVKA